MIPESELVGCKQCGTVFWGKAKAIAQSQGEPACPVCGSRNIDDIDRST